MSLVGLLLILGGSWLATGELSKQPVHYGGMTVYSAQFRLIARGLVDYVAGIDPSAVGLTNALLTLIRSRGRSPSK